jgi:hypothetical protein
MSISRPESRVEDNPEVYVICSIGNVHTVLVVACDMTERLDMSQRSLQGFMGIDTGIVGTQRRVGQTMWFCYKPGAPIMTRSTAEISRSYHYRILGCVAISGVSFTPRKWSRKQN